MYNTEYHTLAIITGLIQGITEFFPVSSSIHLYLVRFFFNKTLIADNTLDIAAHIGTLLSTMICFRQYIFECLRQITSLFIFKKSKKYINYAISEHPNPSIISVILATLPCCISAMLIKRDYSTFSIGIIIIISAVATLTAHKLNPETKTKLTNQDAIIVGIFQALSILPGSSRLGMCIIGMRLLKYDISSTIRYGIILSMPIMIGSLIFHINQISYENIYGFIICALSSYIMGILTIKISLKILSKKNIIKIIGIYRILLGLIFCILI